LVERGRRAPIATFHAPDLSGTGELSLGGPAAHHASVRRLSVGDGVRVTSGCGLTGEGAIRKIGKGDVIIDVTAVQEVPALPLLEVLAPVADRERMLWLAEKCAELAVTVWQPVIFARSRSVSPRGEGEAFATKVRARMIAALEQSAGAWLPEVRREMPLREAAARVAAPTRLLLDAAGAPLDGRAGRNGAAIAFGPEGGLEADERTLLADNGWRTAALALTTLRFETAGIAAVAILRAGGRPTSEER
jgi:16S rRNA (uracil1498-N3)-methyltransferase